MGEEKEEKGGGGRGSKAGASSNVLNWELSDFQGPLSGVRGEELQDCHPL